MKPLSLNNGFYKFRDGLSNKYESITIDRGTKSQLYNVTQTFRSIDQSMDCV